LGAAADHKTVAEESAAVAVTAVGVPGSPGSRVAGALALLFPLALMATTEVT
jgi:hypothetical protein